MRAAKLTGSGWPLLCAAAALSLLGACREPASGGLRAFRASDRAQLFGGPRALGDVGDYVLMNDKIRVVIQNAGFSRGFGVYGGGLIDADMRRPDEEGRGVSQSLGGHDIFAELFPAFFFQAVACDRVDVISDGTRAYDKDYGPMHVHYDEGTAVIRASGQGGEFLTMLRLLDSIFLNFLVPAGLQSDDPDNDPALLKLGVLLMLGFEDFAKEIASLVNVNARYEVDYVLRPGDRHVEIRSRMINRTQEPLPIPSPLLMNPAFRERLGNIDFTGMRVPIGTVMLYGQLNNIWLPGAGFDLRHPFERSFQRGLPLPAFNGVVAEFIASSSYRLKDRVSYGLVAGPSENNFVYRNVDLYRNGGKFVDSWTPIDTSSLLVPFTAISFIGVFGESVAGTIPPGGYVEQVQHFIVGDGDVASIVDEMARMRGTSTGRYEGIMVDTATGQPTAEGQVVIYQELTVTAEDFASTDDYLDAGLRLCASSSPNNLCRPYSQDYPDDDGNLFGDLPEGRYAYRVQAQGRRLGPWVPFEIVAGRRTAIAPVLPRSAWLQVYVADEDGVPLPAKVSLVGQYAEPLSSAVRRSGGVFDLQTGEAYRYSDMLDDRVEGQRGFIEAAGYTDGEGQALLVVRPGDYVAVFSRGFEYDLARVPVHVEEGSLALASAKLTRVVDTGGWMSLDSHLHAIGSIDSAMEIDERVKSIAAEGVEIAIATDHNYVSDWSPAVDDLGLRRWLTSIVGLEFTTLESGHFNAYPLRYQIAPVTHGSLDWFARPPDDMFAALRQLGSLEPAATLVQLNHPRDTMQGYLNQYRLSSLTGDPLSPGMAQRFAGANGPAFFDDDGRSTMSLAFDVMELLNSKLGHQIHNFRVPDDWPPSCYEPLPPDFDPKTDVDPCNLDGKILRPTGVKEALVPGTVLTTVSESAAPGASGLDNVEAVFPGVVDDWFHLLNRGHRFTGVASSDSHGGVGAEAGSPRTMVALGKDEPFGLDPRELVEAFQSRHAATLSNGPFLTFTVAEGIAVPGGVPIGAELAAPSGRVTINYVLSAPPWVSLSRLQLYVNGRLRGDKTVLIDPARDLSGMVAESSGPAVGRIDIALERDSWIVLEAVGEQPMFPVVTGTEEPYLLVADAVGALAAPLGLGGTTNIAVVVVGNEQPYAITNPVWVRLGSDAWQPPGVVPFAEQNEPSQDPHVGVLRTHN